VKYWSNIKLLKCNRVEGFLGDKVVTVDLTFGCLHRVEVDCVADVSVQYASIKRVW